MKKLYLLIPFFLFIGQYGFSQVMSVAAGPSFYIMKYPTFGYFVDSYNRFHARDLSRQMKSFPMASGKYIGFSFGANAGNIEMSYQHFDASTYAEFNSGDKRHFKMKCGYMDILFCLGPSNKNAGIWFYGGGGFGRINMCSYYEYKDGSCNYGLNQLLNGQYFGGYLVGIYGIKASIPVGEKMSILLRAERSVTSHSYIRQPLKDKDQGKAYSYDMTSTIPTDYYHYNEIIAQQTTLPSQYSVLPDIGGFKFTVGVKVDFLK